MMGSGLGWGWLFGTLLIVGLVLLGVVAVRVIGGGVRRERPGPESSRRDDRDEARRLLDERYARGEVSSEEYQERRRVLGEGR